MLADVAVKAAQKARADSLAPDLYRKAENYMLRAIKDYKEGYNDKCKKHADQARIFGEKAEYEALLKQSKLKGNKYQESLRPF